MSFLTKEERTAMTVLLKGAFPELCGAASGCEPASDRRAGKPGDFGNGGYAAPARRTCLAPWANGRRTPFSAQGNRLNFLLPDDGFHVVIIPGR